MKLASQQGFTLTEAMVSTVLFVFLMTGLYTALTAGRVSFASQSGALIAQREARNAIDQLSRELRTVDSISYTATSSDVTFSYTHPSEGTVTYTWTNDTGQSDVYQLVRTTSSATRIVAKDLTAFSLTDNTDNIVVNVTASSDGNMGGALVSLQLVKKIGLR